jgi:hypothetical protein
MIRVSHAAAEVAIVELLQLLLLTRREPREDSSELRRVCYYAKHRYQVIARVAI